jgi:alanyl-tRNA synthetase
MNSTEVRKLFLEYFEARGHRIVPSAPIVVKNDPTLMFNNAGMNQFKDFFLGNQTSEAKRIADTQKCLRVSGKHNDLEEVGVDTYHHTMFEMLGNWSFGDYFKEEAIAWAWELLTEVYKLDKSRLYVTVFEGDKEDGLPADEEAESIWKKFIDPQRIIRANKKDNFWEMGKTGPCGACSEIHYDLRSQEEIAKQGGKELVNADHPQVIEIWNLVFMEYNRLEDRSLQSLPEKHVDTGMGFERLVRAIQLKQSNYDTDLFQDSINMLESQTGITYGEEEEKDIAFRVIADHIRALSFAVADGQLPSNTGAGYVLRRILRRAVRYGYTFLNLTEAFMFKLVKPLAIKFADVFPELQDQQDFVAKVIKEEEISFYRTLTTGLIKLDEYLSKNKEEIAGAFAFELFDTYGFPFDLTQLIATEKGIAIDKKGFKAELEKQKKRSKQDAEQHTGDWIEISSDDVQEFVGYDRTETQVRITRYRTVESKGKKQFQLVFNFTPFYAESGGQVGDTGFIEGVEDGEKVSILDTQKENNLIVHFAKSLPKNLEQSFLAYVAQKRRALIMSNHSATHLVHAALKQVLGDHVAQKGSLVNDKHLRFDFSHFSKVSDDEIQAIEQIVNEKIREGIALQEQRNVPYQEAIDNGVTALFGEKYGDVVRVISFDRNFSTELCGGTHVSNTAQIGGFKITSESSVAAGVRRIEAITSEALQEYMSEKLSVLGQVEDLLGNPKDPAATIEKLLQDHKSLRKQIEAFEKEKAGQLKENLLKGVTSVHGINVILEKVEVSNAGQLKDLAFQLKNEVDNLFLVLAAKAGGKPNITIMISDDLIQQKGWKAGDLVRSWAKHIKGGGGGQPFFAQAGGKDLSGLDAVIKEAKEFLN